MEQARLFHSLMSMSHITNKSLGPTRRRKQEVAKENERRVAYRKMKEKHTRQGWRQLFIILHLLGQSVPKEQWGIAEEPGKTYESVIAWIDEVKSTIPEVFYWGFPSDLREQVLADPEKFKPAVEALGSMPWTEWFTIRNSFVTKDMIKYESYARAYERIHYGDSGFLTFGVPQEEMRAAGDRIAAYWENQRSDKMKEVAKSQAPAAERVAHGKSKLSERDQLTLVFIGLALGVTVGLICWGWR